MENKQLTRADVIPGARFGRWTVLEINVKNPQSKAKRPLNMAKCQCDCGTVRYKEFRDLYSGRSLSCGCKRTEQLIQMNDEKGRIEVGTQFGYLTMIKDLGYRKQNSRDQRVRWSLCRCVCGNEIEVLNNNLKTGGTKSCGCVNSFGERKIIKILLDNKINFSTQYTFHQLKGVGNGSLRFDFAIFDDNNNLIELIEFDGRQHYEGPDGKWSHSYSKEIIQENDLRKNRFCEENNIKLIRVPYFKIDELSLELLELENYKKEE